MKKVIFWLIILILIGGGIWYATRKAPVPVDTTVATYRNSNLGISFTYPKILTASSAGNSVTLHHEVPFTHHDFCDFKGEATTTINTLTDLNVNFHVVNKNLVSTMQTESPYIPAENFVNGQVVESPGFIDAYASGDLKGYKIFEGAEGCGHTIYYLQVTSDKTLVVTDDLITVFTGAIDQDIEQSAKAVPGVLNREKEAEIFESIMKTVKVQ